MRRTYTVVEQGATKEIQGFGCDVNNLCQTEKRSASDIIGEFTFTCCSDEDLCNFNQVLAPPPPPALIGRPDCGIESYTPKPWVDYKGGATKIEDLSGFVMQTDAQAMGDLRSKWTFGVQPPSISSFVRTRDTSSPDCYVSSSFVSVRGPG